MSVTTLGGFMETNQCAQLLDIEGIAHTLNLIGDKKNVHQKIYHMISRKEIPAFKLAGRWYCRKQALIETLIQLESMSSDISK